MNLLATLFEQQMRMQGIMPANVFVALQEVNAQTELARAEPVILVVVESEVSKIPGQIPVPRRPIYKAQHRGQWAKKPVYPVLRKYM